MPLCRSVLCGCSLQSTEAIVSGSGGPGDPWVISGITDGKGSRAARLADTNLFEGKTWWETDSHQVWKYSLAQATWFVVTGMFVRDGAVVLPTAANPQLINVGGSTIVNTDASGFATLSYGLIFSSAPAIVVNNATPSQNYVVHQVSVPGTSSVSLHVVTAAGANVATTAVRVNWIAVGYGPAQ